MVVHHTADSLGRIPPLDCASSVKKILWCVPKKHRAKLDARWRYGVFLGRASNCDQNYVGLANGSIVAARAIVRLVPSLRWNMERLGMVKGTPMDFKTKEYDSIEEDVSPHTHPDDRDDQDLVERENRRMQISYPHLRQYGFTDGCRRCELHKQGLHARAKHLRHSEECRSRIYRAIKAEKGQVGEEEDKRLEVKHKPKPLKEPDEPKEKVVDPAPDTPVDVPMDMAPAENLDIHNDDVDIGGDDNGMDMFDTTEFHQEVDDAFMENNDVNDAIDSDGQDHEMTAIMDILQTLGVEAEEANRFSARVMRISSQPLNPTFVEVYGCGNIVHAANHVLRNLNVEGLCAFDLRTAKSSGDPWDFSRKADRKQALQYVQEKKPTWLIGSPPCTAFSRLQGLNYHKMDPARVAKIIREAKRHLHFVLSLYQIQLDANRHFLHEHPVGATSWLDDWMQKILAHPRVGTAVADQCMYDLTTTDADGNVVRAKKPTKWASSSPQMLSRLSRKCDGSHPHQHLIGGRAAAAAYYPPKLISQILRGIRDTADAEHKEPDWDPAMAKEMVRVAMCHDVPSSSLMAAYKASDLAHSNAKRKVLFKYLSGKEVSLSLDDNFKPQYKDEYTNEVLPFESAKDAMLDELQYFCSIVFRGVSLEEAVGDKE